MNFLSCPLTSSQKIHLVEKMTLELSHSVDLYRPDLSHCHGGAEDLPGFLKVGAASPSFCRTCSSSRYSSMDGCWGFSSMNYIN
mmetsp:Transcript_1079/g.1273  ORF Transcript_1079/g.1273 Transcript_1079/m.1273 type:complete len:84 (+) Transcript_1079:997-1248(+)